MTSDERFKPPAAATDSRLFEPAPSRAPVAVLTLLALLQVAWLATWGGRYLSLVSGGAMNPVGPFLCVVGCACLYVGLLRAWAGRGRNLFIAAVVLLALGLFTVAGRSALFGVASIVFIFMPFVLALGLSAVGAALAWTRTRPRGEAA